MKIGFVLPGFSASEEDWCIPAMLKLVRELARQNEVHVFPLRYPYRRSRYSVFGAEVHSLGGADARGLARLPLLGRAFISIFGEHRHKHFDVLHGFWGDEAGFVVAHVSKLLKVPSVVSVMGGELVAFPDIGYGSQMSRVNRHLVRMALSGARAVTVGSSYLRQLAQPYVDPERLRFLPIGVDTGMFHPHGESSLSLRGEFKLLHVASLVPVKNQTLLLHALSHIRNAMRGVHLHIVGDGPLREALERLAQSLGVSGNVTFHGQVPHDQLPHYYREADLCVLASRHEGQEWVTQEAAACGRSTVGTEVGVVPDLEPATRAVPLGNAAALAREVVDLAAQPRLTRSMGRAARGRIEKCYALSHTTRNLQALYMELNRAANKLCRGAAATQVRGTGSM